MKALYTLIIIVLLLSACSKTGNKPELNTDTNVKFSGQLDLADFSLKVPDNWVQEKPSSSMRTVQYYLKEDNSVNITGFYFGNQPEMADANIQRWKSEFSQTTSTDQIMVANGKVTLVTISGTFKKKPFPMAEEFTEMPDYMTLASIVPSSQGPYFFKMVGPQKVVQKQYGVFKAFLNSYVKK